MKSNKLFVVQGLYFNLPDKFNGDISDALELFIKYYRKKKKDNGNAKLYPPAGDFIPTKNMNVLLNDEDAKLFGNFSIIEGKDNNWKTITGDKE